MTSNGDDGRLVLEGGDYTSESDLTRALAALALLRWTPGTAGADSLLTLLEASQVASGDGSLAQDPYATALALHACAAKLGTDDPALQAAIYLPDYGLRRAINQALGKPNAAAVVARSEIQMLASLDLTLFGVTDLTGLEEATNLTSLTLSVNTQPDESPLSGIPGLTVIRPTQSFPQPTGLLATDGDFADAVELTWNGFSGATYSVYRYSKINQLERVATRLESPIYRDTSARPGWPYFYQVTADAPGDPPVEGPMSEAEVGHRRLVVPDFVITQVLGAEGDGVTPLSDVKALAVGLDGTVYVAAASAVFAAHRDGTITDLVAAAGGTLDGLVDPAGIAVDNEGFVYLSSSGTNEVFEIDPATGTAALLLDATGDGSHPLSEPTAIALGATGNVYVAGSSSNNVFEVTTGGVVTEFIDANGDGTHPLLTPRGLAVDEEGAVYVSGSGFGSWSVFKIDPGGSITQVIDELGDGAGSGDSPLESPLGVAVNDAGQLFVAGSDSDNLYRIAPAGEITRLLDATTTGGGFLHPTAVAVDQRGSVIAAAEGSDTVYRVKRSELFEVLLDASGDGAHALSQPSALAVDPGGNVYIGGQNNVFRVATGAVQIADGSGDGSSPLDFALAIAVAESGEIFAAGRDSDNVFRISLDGSISEIINSSGDGTHPLSVPFALAVGDDGSVYVSGADSNNVFRIAPWGQIRQLMDSGSGLDSPHGLYSANGSLWVASLWSDKVFKLDPFGTPTVVLDESGDGLNPLDGPRAIVGRPGEIYVGGRISNNVFRVSTETGAVQQVIGPDGDGVNPLDGPSSLALSASSLFVAGISSRNVFEIDLADDSIRQVIDVTGDGVTSLGSPRQIAVDEAKNLYVSSDYSNAVFRRDPLGRIDRVLDFTGDGLNPADAFGAVAASPASDDFIVGTYWSDNVFATIPVPEPAWYLQLPPLLVGLWLLFRAQERRARRNRHRRVGRSQAGRGTQGVVNGGQT